MANSLAEVLGAPPPAAVAALPDPAQEQLAELIRTARRQQAHDLDAAFDAVVKNVPLPVRAIARRILRG